MKVLMPATRLPLPLIHRLIAVIILSGEVPLGGRIFKESVKVCTPKSPAISDNFPFDFASLHAFPHCSRAQSQHFRGLPQREQVIADDRSHVSP
jgi:hypothetical protein